MNGTEGVQHIVVVQREGVRVTEVTLEPGAAVPAHHHSQLTDVFYGLEGKLVLIVNGRELQLVCGQSHIAEPGAVHSVRNAGSKKGRFLLVQSGGEYDFIKV